nr:hypothetical protein [Tanacetum cinerariifolium]
FGYRLNPRYAIKECSSCGTLYTRDCSCSKGNVEDKILVPKPPRNCARCGHPVDGPYCQGCALLQKELEEDLVTHFQDFQNTSESSDDNTNIVNAPREPFVVKQDQGSFVDKLICDLHTFSPNQSHCFHCKDVLRDGKACQRCTCKRCGSGLSKGLCLICGNNLNSLNDSLNECCCECGEALDGIIYQQCALPCVSKPNFVDKSSNIFKPPPKPPIYSCEFCGSNAQYGHYCTPQALFINSEPDYSQYFNFPQDIHNFQQQKFNRYSFFETPKVLLLAWHRVFEIKDAFENKKYKPEDVEELFRKLLDDLQNIHEELADFINSPGLNRPAVYDDDDDDVDYTNAITPVLSTEEPDNSLKVEMIVTPEDEETEDDNLHEKLLNVNLLIAEIEALKDNPTPSSEFLTKSSSTSPKSFLEGTNTFHNSLPEFENFYFDLEEISSGSTTTHSDISLPEYEAFSFYDDHIEEISSGSTTTQSDNSLPEYDSFIFDLSNDQFPPTDRSDFTHEEFGDESAHIISLPKYDCFYFGNLPNPGELISSLNSGIHENLSSTTCVNLPVEDDYSPLLVYDVWIFLAYLTYPVIPPHLHLFGNEDTIFDPSITINRFYSFKPGLSHRCGTFKKFNTHRSHLNESPMEMLFSTLFLMNQ